MKFIYIITSCICLLAYFSPPVDSFGCSAAMCPIFPIFSSICCVMAHQCCHLALQRV
uniref:Uncharacterized protein n=1 Tax=Parasteatoda tepidariorum TaxID=114398 RepID=A0A2L2YVZ6_PARTP